MECAESVFCQAVDLLKRGELVAFPTETVYGLGALALSEEAVKKIFTVKRRPLDNPLIVHVGSIEEAAALAIEIPDSFTLLANTFWPGPLTIVLQKHPRVPELVSAGHPTIALRMPAHPLALRLIQAVGEPLAAPSANLSGRPSPTSARDVEEDLGEEVSLILDGGECAVGIESTVIQLTGSEPMLLRPGAISREELETVLQTSVCLAGQDTPAYSPGMRHRHYAPKARVKLFLHPELPPSGHPYILSSEKEISAHIFQRRTFYACLREADRLGVEEIGVHCGPSILQDAALMNRIFRSAGWV